MPDTFGDVEKAFTEEGPFKARFEDIQVNDPSALSEVRLWMTDPDSYETYFLASGDETTADDGSTVYDFFGNTQNAQRLKDDKSLESSAVELETDKIYLAEVSYQIQSLNLKAVGARREVLIRESYSIKSN